MKDTAPRPISRRSLRAALLALGPLAVGALPACSGDDAVTEPPGASAGAAAIGGAGGAAAGSSTGATAGTAGDFTGATGAAAGVGGSNGGDSGGLGGSAGTGAAAGGASTGGASTGGASGGGAGSGGANSGGATSGGAGAGASGGLAAGGAAGAAGTAAAGAAGAQPATDRTSAWNDPDYGCGNCHGDNGEGIEDRGPEIRHPNRELFDFMVKNGDDTPIVPYKDPMPAVDPKLISSAILDDIYTWLGGFPQPTTGADLYADYCGYCHGPEGRGGTTNAYVMVAHSVPFDVQGAAFLAVIRDGHTNNGTIPVSERTEWMPAIPASVLTDAEVGLIEAWLPKN